MQQAAITCGIKNLETSNHADFDLLEKGEMSSLAVNISVMTRYAVIRPHFLRKMEPF